MKRVIRRLLGAVIAVSATTAVAAAQPDDDSQFRSLYRELVEINTTRSAGSCTAAADAMRAHLAAAGFAAQNLNILAPAERPQDGTLIAELPGRDRAKLPILLMAHLDVVEVRPEDWARDPFKLTEDNGVFYARGSSDDKAMAAIFVDSLVRYVRHGYQPRRSLKLALTCGEETPDVFNSVQWLMQTQPHVLHAVFALNEGAFGELDGHEKPVALQVQAGEKTYQDFSVETSGMGGHSARPLKTNPIVRLSAGLAKLGTHNFAISLNEATRGYFAAQMKLVSPTVAADMQAVLDRSDEAAAQRLWDVSPNWNGMLRTTCVVTQIQGGQAPNALPERARANVNCRILPGVAIATVQAEMVATLGDEALKVTPTGVAGVEAPAPSMSAAILTPVRQVAQDIWPGVPVVPTMLTAATDGRFLNAGGIPTYGISGIFQGVEGSNAHGINEHIRVKSLLDARRFLYELVKRYGDSPGFGP